MCPPENKNPKFCIKYPNNEQNKTKGENYVLQYRRDKKECKSTLYRN